MVTEAKNQVQNQLERLYSGEQFDPENYHPIIFINEKHGHKFFAQYVGHEDRDPSPFLKISRNASRDWTAIPTRDIAELKIMNAEVLLDVLNSTLTLFSRMRLLTPQL